MAADVYLMIVDSQPGVVVVERWIGGNATRDLAPQVLQRPPDHAAPGYAAWGRITRSEAHQLTDYPYADGLTEGDVAQLAQQFPPGRFWWSIWVDF